MIERERESPRQEIVYTTLRPFFFFLLAYRVLDQNAYPFMVTPSKRLP